MAEDGLIDWLADELAEIGQVSSRRMMGGFTVYLDGTVFAILADGEIWFKADADSDAIWEEAGCERFTFTMGEGRTGSMNYRRAPAEAYDDGDALRRWAALALAAGHRAPARKPRCKPSG